MANGNETVREVCAEMRGMGNYQSFSGDHARELANRIESAHEREMAEKDAEIARLNDELFAYAGGHIITGAERYMKERNNQLDAEIARLKAALKPVLECKTKSAEGSMPNYMGCLDAVSKAQRVMREGGK